MKKFFLLIAPLFFALSCDYVDDPYAGGVTPPNPTDSAVMQNILIEDFTGHLCNNCPDAADMIHTLQHAPQFEGRVIGVAIHTGFFATPLAPPFDTDHRTVEGDDIGTFFGITSTTGFPTGMVNRKDYPNSNLKPYNDWPTHAAEYLNKEALVDIKSSTAYNASNRQLNLTVDLEWQRDTAGASHKILAMLTENNIKGAQKLPDQSTDTAYIFEHMFRRTFNGIYGEDCGSANITQGDQEQHSWNISLDAEWKENDCYIVVLVFDATTQEIKQVIEIPAM